MNINENINGNLEENQSESRDVEIVEISKKCLIITSDPQYPWTKESDDGVAQKKKETKKKSYALIFAQYNSINEYISRYQLRETPVIINGDITAYGHTEEWREMLRNFGYLGYTYYYSLGNHDIENNKGNCSGDNCLRNSIAEMGRFLKAKRIEDSTFDCDFHSDQEAFGGVSGSLAYSFRPKETLGIPPVDLEIINLQYYPTYSVTAKGLPTLECTQGLDWFRNKMNSTSCKNIILCVHKPDNWRDGTSQEFLDILKKHDSKILAVFCGHYHTKLGRYYNYTSYFNNKPVFLSGSASQETYLIVEYDKDTMEIYSVRNNKPKERTLISTLKMNQ